MTTFSRADNSLLSRWWWTVDRWLLTSLLLIVAIGTLMTLAASPPVADRLGLDTYHFANRQFVFLPFAILIMISVSLLNPLQIRRLAAVGFIGALGLTIMTLGFGSEIKGASRWISVAGFSLQPSEFLKPTFVVVTAWMFAEGKRDANFPGQQTAILLFVIVAGTLVLQPDIGMTIVVAAVWGVQFFLAGLPIFFVVFVAALFLGGSLMAYMTFDHVKRRIDIFMDPASGDSYQITRSMEAFRNGGVFGTGPGEGSVKEYLPDAHTDFILAVAGEEFGLIACLLIVGLFAAVVLRGYIRIFRETNFFVLVAAGGLVTQFGLQALINMASTTHLMPTKGMTLPFISYGGSSLMALALGMGMLLALTRKRAGESL